MSARYVIGVDFGTESARAIIVDTSSGQELDCEEAGYSSRVIDRVLPTGTRQLPPDWALQDPDDYLESMTTAIRAIMSRTGIDAASVIGIGIDFTSCTILPVRGSGEPLTRDPKLAADPHAWVKLWKHHAAQAQADRINALASAENETWLARFGGKISSEWLWPKMLELVEESPLVYQEADRILEAEDWIVWQLTGTERRARVAAGYKAIYLPDQGGYPRPEFLGKLHPALSSAATSRLTDELCEPGERVGTLCGDMAIRLGLAEGTAVATANMDAVASVAACGVVDPFVMVMVMGTSTCDLVLAPDLVNVEGMCGAVQGAVVPDLWAYESGQASVGDLFGWFIRNCVPGSYERDAATSGRDLFAHLEVLAARLTPGESGVVALDWWNGNRSVLVDADVTGLLLGMTIATRPEEIYRALLEATAFGKRVIIEAFERAGVPIERLVACGGLATKSPLLMQIYADVTGREIAVATSRQTPALGAALHAAVAAGSSNGGYGTIEDAARALASPTERVYAPRSDAARRYDTLYEAYSELHDLFGRDRRELMRDLRAGRRRTSAEERVD